MLDALFQKYVARFTNSVIGLAIYVQNDGEHLFCTVQLEKDKGGELQVVSHDTFQDIEHLAQWINEEERSRLPVIWGIDGRSVLFKVSELDAGLDKSALMSLLVPNADGGDFYLNYLEQEGRYLSTMVRSTAYDEMAQNLHKAGIYLSKGYLGPLSFWHLKEHLVATGQEKFQFGLYQVEERTDHLTINRNLKGMEEPVGDNYPFSHVHLNAFGYAASFFAGSAAGYFDMPNALKAMELESIHRSVFKKIAIGVIVLLLVVFVGNTMVFLNLNSKNQVLNEGSANLQQLVNTYNQRKRTFDAKNKIVEKLNYSNIGMAWIGDRIGAIVPNKVVLQNLKIDPLSSNKRKKESPFQGKVLALEGECSNNEAFGELITNLIDLDFIDGVVFQDYQFNKTTKKGEFEIQVKYKETNQ